MKIDTSSYYPKSPLDDDPEAAGEIRGTQEQGAIFAPRAAEPADEPEPQPETKPEPKPATVKKPQPDHETSTVDRVLDGVATFFSWAFVPLLMPVYGMLLAFHLSALHFKPDEVKWIFTLIVAAFNLVIPMVLVLLLKRFGLVEDVGLNGRKERLIPYIITIVCMAGTGLFMHAKLAPMWLVMFFEGGAVAGAINLLINFKWKISAHAAGVAGLVALIVRIMHSEVSLNSITVWLMVAIGVAGVLGSSRVWLGRHTVWQVLAGYAVGFCSVFFMTMIQ